MKVNDKVCTRDFKYYIFDWDDNILHMPTRIRMERRGEDGVWREVGVSTATFALVRADTENYRPPVGGWNEAFRDFQDVPGRDNLIEDTISALERIEHGETPARVSTPSRKLCAKDASSPLSPRAATPRRLLKRQCAFSSNTPSRRPKERK